MLYITAVHMTGQGVGHEHIGSVKWTNTADGKSSESTRATIVDWIENMNGVAKVKSGTTEVAVGVVNASPKFLRTHADGVWTDNLLALPRY